jgi:hypothetical protein
MKLSVLSLFASAVVVGAAETSATEGLAAMLSAAIGDRIKHVIVLMEEVRRTGRRPTRPRALTKTSLRSARLSARDCRRP